MPHELMYGEYLDACAKEQSKHPEWRQGQTLFNVLVEVRPDLSEQIRGTALDPFYNAAKVPTFLDFVAEKW